MEGSGATIRWCSRVCRAARGGAGVVKVRGHVGVGGDSACVRSARCDGPQVNERLSWSGTGGPSRSSPSPHSYPWCAPAAHNVARAPLDHRVTIWPVLGACQQVTSQRSCMVGHQPRTGPARSGLRPASGRRRVERCSLGQAARRSPLGGERWSGHERPRVLAATWTSISG